MFSEELRCAALNLPTDVARWVLRALNSDWFRIEPGAYEEGGPGGAVCPIVAAATMAGIWGEGKLLPGNQAWGSPKCPTSEVEDFAAYFDLCAEESGTPTAIDTVRAALDPASRRKLAA